jgi:hypothetical protein
VANFKQVTDWPKQVNVANQKLRKGAVLPPSVSLSRSKTPTRSEAGVLKLFEIDFFGQATAAT